MASSLHLVRKDLRRFVEALPRFEPSLALVHAMRQGSALPMPTMDEQGVQWREVLIDRPDAPPVRVLLYRPLGATAPTPVILHFHGGGYIAGRPEIAHANNVALCRDLHAAIVSVAYRLAPETPFPGALDDAHAALLWIAERADAHGFDTARIAVKGESAGGGLAAGLALLARDRGDVAIAFQCLTYPMLDDRPAADPHPYAGEFVWTDAFNQFAWDCYLRGNDERRNVSPYAAPSRAPSLDRLPPTLIITGALDLFADENLDYARRLMRAGVPVEAIVYPGTVHGFGQAGATALKARYDQDIRTAFREAFG